MKPELLVRSKFMVSREFGTGDIPKEPLVTIAGVKKPEEKEALTQDWWLLSFKEPWAKPLKIITTHQQALMLMFGADDTDPWIGKRIGLRAVVGFFYNRRQTAVRIKGSPDIKAPCSFSVRKFGGGSDNYDMVVMPDPNGPRQPAAPKVYPPTGTVDFGTKKGTQIVQLTPEELAEAIALGTKNIIEAKPGAGWVAKTQANLNELLEDQRRRAALEQQIDGPPTEPQAEDAPF